jgi:hypothetical protein
MRCCDGFFMGNSLSDPKDLLIPFLSTNPTDEPTTSDSLLSRAQSKKMA